jgi:glycosyltransferase involved in cell wall biosynthesis
MVWHVHDFVGARPLIAGLLKRVAPRDLTAIAITQAVADDVRNWLPGAEVRVVLNGIDTARYAPGQGNPGWLDRIAGWDTPPADCVRVGLVATYARWKGQDIFIRAAAKLARDPANANLRFYIVGGPIYTTRGSQFSAEELQELIDSLGVRDRVALTGRADDLVQIYRALDVVVHASTKPEPFGLMIAEAMSCGRAVIVSAAGGARELFTPEVDAIGVTSGDVDAMAQEIARLARDPQLRGTLGNAAREMAVAKFDRARMAREMLSVYTSLRGR